MKIDLKIQYLCSIGPKIAKQQTCTLSCWALDGTKSKVGDPSVWEGYGVIVTSKQTNKQTPTFIYTFQVK